MSLTLRRRSWRLPDDAPDDSIQSLAAAVGVPAPVARALHARGLRSPAEAASFLDPPPPSDPLDLPDMAAAVDRLCRARDTGKGVLIFGDYDCDGVCSAALCARVLETLGWRAHVHLPRREDGYGLREDTLVGLARAADCRVVLAVDNGSTAHAAIAEAVRAGVEVVVADHHRLGPELPAAAAVVNPLRAPESPFASLAGVGVAWCLARALEAAVGRPSPADLELVAIGTIADVVPLRGANRWLVREGLRAMGGPDARPGVRALLAACGIHPGTVPAERAISHGVAPRLNAPGRLEGPAAAYELLAAGDDAAAASALAAVQRCNDLRRAMGADVLAAAERGLRASPAPSGAVVLADPSWSPGLVGPAASALAERLGVPVLLGAVDEQGLCRGSGRAPAGWDLVAALTACAPHLTRFGGHTQAAGFETRIEHLPALREAFVARCAETAAAAAGPAPELPLDGELDGAGELRPEVAAALERLAPFGSGSPVPAFLLRCVRVVGARTVGEAGTHVRLRLLATAGEDACTRAGNGSAARERRTAGGELAAVAFGMGLWAEGFASGGPFDLVVQPVVDRYRGREELQLVVLDAAPADGDWTPFLAAARDTVARQHPDREGLAATFRRLAAMGRDGKPLPPDPVLLTRLVPDCLPGGESARAALTVLRELGLVDGDGRFSPPPSGSRVDLAASPRYRAAEEARSALAQLATAVEAGG